MSRPLRRIFQLYLCAFCVCVSSFGQGTITAVYVPTSIAGGGGPGATGYPYAVYVRIQGWTLCANAQAYVKLYSTTGLNEYMWTGAAWSDSNKYSPSYQPVVNIDAGGNWEGWVYAKHNDLVGSIAYLRSAKTSATGTNTKSAQISFTVLNTGSAGNGGWIFRNVSVAPNKCVVAYSGGAVVGSYRSEDNGIAEGYTYASGGFKIAVPAGLIDSLVVLNDNATRDGSFVGPWTVRPGLETDVSIEGGPLGKGSARIIPSTLSGGTPQLLAVSVKGDTSGPIGSVRVIVPANWQWGKTTADVIVTAPGTPTTVVSGDTILLAGLALNAADSAVIQFSNIVPYDSTGTYTFWTETGASSSSLSPLSTHPSVFIYGTPIPISEVKRNDISGVPIRNNQLVTVRGVVTVAGQFGTPSYIEDNSGGLAIYGGTFSSAVATGDEVIVTGLVQPFRGLTEIVNPMLHAIASSGNTVTPTVVTAQQLANDGQGGVEEFEGRLVRVDGASVAGGGTWAGNTNYSLNDATGSTQLRIDDATDLVGATIPGSSFDVIGVVGQFVSVSPYIGGYQLMPRSKADVLASGPLFATMPAESAIQPRSLTIEWQTVNTGTTGIRYGKTPALELGLTAVDDSMRTAHSLTLSGLDPATVYYIGAFSASGADTSVASILIASTASPAQTTGEMNVYFNTTVRSELAWYQPANGSQNLVSRIVTRINSAHRSIDAALYSLSGYPGPGTDIVYALVSARSRGVKVRVICEDDNSNSTPFNMLRSSGIPVVTDRFDAVNAGAGLMHNKFFVIDGRGGAPDSIWVWTGSWNPTDPGTNNDAQNSIEFQDAALAAAYELEFNEMWGSSDDTPIQSASRFGARKTDNTPHRFVIGGRNVECYFSPSDRTTSHIVAAINGAQHSVAVGTMTLTRTDIAAALIAKKNAGRKTRVILDNNTDSGTQYATLLSSGVDVRVKTGTGYLFHHKYAVVDGEDPGWDAVVITGSHNWSSSAENSNNENTVIVHDGNVANQYLQEFAARYYQYGGGDTIYVGVEQVSASVPATFALEQNFPNPFNPSTVIEYTIAEVTGHQPASVRPDDRPGGRGLAGRSDVRGVKLVVYDLLGREVATLVNEEQPAGKYRVTWNAAGLASGVYFYRLTAGLPRSSDRESRSAPEAQTGPDRQAGSFVESRKMVLVK